MSDPIDPVSFSLSSPSPLDLLALQIEQQRLDDEAEKNHDVQLRKSAADCQRAIRRAVEDEKKRDEAEIESIKNPGG